MRLVLVAFLLVLPSIVLHAQGGDVQFVTLDGPLLSECTGNDAGTTPVCRVKRQFTRAALLARLRDQVFWAEGDTLTVAYRGTGRAVSVCCGVQGPLSPVGGGDLWVLSMHVPGLSRARLSLGFVVNDSAFVAPPTLWRGPAAPPAIPASATLHGRILVDTIASYGLEQPREVTVYLPPWGNATFRPVVYLADGQAVNGFAPLIDTLIASGAMPPVALVGVHAALRMPGTPPDQDPRSLEYIDAESPLFVRHAKAFLEEVPAWAERRFGVAATPAGRAVWGGSNSGYYALYMGLMHPEHFGHAIGFSPAGRKPDVTAAAPARAADFQIVSGTLEPRFTAMARAWEDGLRSRGFTVARKEYIGGHDNAVWAEEFVDAVRKAFWGR